MRKEDKLFLVEPRHRKRGSGNKLNHGSLPDTLKHFFTVHVRRCGVFIPANIQNLSGCDPRQLCSQQGFPISSDAFQPHPLCNFVIKQLLTQNSEYLSLTVERFSAAQYCH